MSQHIEWASGGFDWTVNPGQWVDENGSRNNGVALWAGDGDGTIIEFADVEAAVKVLRAVADALEGARDTSRYDTCRWCGQRIVLVPEEMDGELTVWVHVDELGAEVPTVCGDTDRDVSPAHRYVDDEPYCRDCGTDREDDELPCIPVDQP